MGAIPSPKSPTHESIKSQIISCRNSNFLIKFSTTEDLEMMDSKHSTAQKMKFWNSLLSATHVMTIWNLLWKNLRWKSKFSWHYNLQGHHIPEEQNTWHSIKPTHNFQYLHRESAYSPPVFRGFVKGEFIRHARNTSDPSIFTKTLNKFKTHFSKRGYSDKETDPIILEICETNRTKYLHKKSTDSKQRQPNVMITKYNPHIKGLKKRILEHWKLLQKDPICKEMFNIEPIIAYSKHKSISELIIHSRLQ